MQVLKRLFTWCATMLFATICYAVIGVVLFETWTSGLSQMTLGHLFSEAWLVAFFGFVVFTIVTTLVNMFEPESRITAALIHAVVFIVYCNAAAAINDGLKITLGDLYNKIPGALFYPYAYAVGAGSSIFDFAVGAKNTFSGIVLLGCIGGIVGLILPLRKRSV